MKLQKAQELGKAELAAAIASEKAAQIEKMAEANLHVSYLLVETFGHETSQKITSLIFRMKK